MEQRWWYGDAAGLCDEVADRTEAIFVLILGQHVPFRAFCQLQPVAVHGLFVERFPCHIHPSPERLMPFARQQRIDERGLGNTIQSLRILRENGRIGYPEHGVDA